MDLSKCVPALRLEKTIKLGHVKRVRKLVQQNDFWKYYKKRWTDSCTPALIVAIRKRTNKEKMVRVLLQNGTDVFERCAETNRCALEEAIQIDNKKIFHMIANHGYVGCNDCKVSGPILVKLLVFSWFKEFEEFLHLTGVDVNIFFHTIDTFHFPFHELCAATRLEAIEYLMDKYDTNILNFAGTNILGQDEYDTVTVKLMLFRQNVHIYGKVDAHESREHVQYPEEELLWCFGFHVDEFMDINESDYDEKEDIVDKLFDHICHVDKLFDHICHVGATVCEKNIKHNNKQQIVEKNFIFYLLYMNMFEFESNYITKVEDVLKNVIGNHIYTISLAYALYGPTYIDGNRIKELIAKGADYMSDFSLHGSIPPIAPMLQYGGIKFSDNIIVQIITTLYQIDKIQVNIRHDHFGYVHGNLLEIVLVMRHFSTSSDIHYCRPNFSKIVKIMNAAGEKYELAQDQCVFYPLEQLKVIKICPYRGPGEGDKWLKPIFQDILNRRRKKYFLPSLFQITRKLIRFTISQNHPHLNMYTTIPTLPIPYLITKYLLFDEIVDENVPK